MPRRSPRKKPVSPELIVESDDGGFAAVASDAVASDDQYVSPLLLVVSCNLFFSLVALTQRKKTNPSKTVDVGKRTSIIPLSPLSEKSLPQIRVSSQMRKTKSKLPPLYFFFGAFFNTMSAFTV